MTRKFVYVITALLFCANVSADDHAIGCHGCSDWQKEQAASAATQRGKVTIFDRYAQTVTRYSVFTEMLDVRPRTTWTSVNRISVDAMLKTRWRNYVESVRGVEHPGVVTLPDSFPMQSVAGALLDPVMTSTALENHLMQLPAYQQLTQSASSLIGRMLQLDLGVLDLSEILKAVTFETEFPDGSTMEYTVSFSINQGTGLARLEVSPWGNAMTADGAPVPTSDLGFRGRTFHDRNGSLIEWVSLARSHGVVVHGEGSTGTVMECKVSGNKIECTVRPAR